MDEPYVSLEELAKYFSVSPSTVRNWMREDKVPALKIGGVYRFKKSEVEDAFRTKGNDPYDIDEDGEDELPPEQLELNFDIDNPDEDL